MCDFLSPFWQVNQLILTDISLADMGPSESIVLRVWRSLLTDFSLRKLMTLPIGTKILDKYSRFFLSVRFFPFIQQNATLQKIYILICFIWIFVRHNFSRFNEIWFLISYFNLDLLHCVKDKIHGCDETSSSWPGRIFKVNLCSSTHGQIWIIANKIMLSWQGQKMGISYQTWQIFAT